MGIILPLNDMVEILHNLKIKLIAKTYTDYNVLSD